MFSLLVLCVWCYLIPGCAGDIPTQPGLNESAILDSSGSGAVSSDNHHLWGLWAFYIPESHDSVIVEPQRDVQVHLNVLKKLEVGDCTNCLTIKDIHNNYDSTVDLTVQIRHPYPGQPQLTGFDVKGIVMFNGSYTAPSLKKLAPYPDPFVVSWRELGDPELLNPDGYTLLWSPSYDSGSDLPILNYWPGKFSNGTPTANLNAFINYYTTEERHMFACDGIVQRTYHLYIPPGPLVVGYAVDACWCPPDVTPVVNPLVDFPISANQSEPYFVDFVVNNGEVIDFDLCCGWNMDDRCSDLHLEYLEWAGHTMNVGFTYQPPPNEDWTLHNIFPCEIGEPGWLQILATYFTGYSGKGFPDGTYRCIGFVYRGLDMPGQPILRDRFAYTVYDVTVDRD
jgi:hypothetical protein